MKRARPGNYRLKWFKYPKIPNSLKVLVYDHEQFTT